MEINITLDPTDFSEINEAVAMLTGRGRATDWQSLVNDLIKSIDSKIDDESLADPIKGELEKIRVEVIALVKEYELDFVSEL